MNYYPFHIGDYASATRHLTWDEDAAFRRLLDLYYGSEKPIPLEPRSVYRLVVASTPEQREAVDTVLAEFFERTDDGWINRRADAEIAAMREKQHMQREKANRRWNKQRAESGNAPAMPRHANGDSAASNDDADAMPPTPTPTPTPTPKKKREEERADPEATVTDHVRSPSGSRIPDGFPDAGAIDWCKQHRQDLDPLATAERFRDHWVAKPGKDGRKLDWPATWRNWVRGERAPPVRAGPAKADRNAEIIAQLTGRQPAQREIVIDAECRPVQAARIG